MKLRIVACLAIAAASQSAVAAKSWLEESNERIKALTRQEAPEWLKPRPLSAETEEIVGEIAERGESAIREAQGIKSAPAKQSAGKAYQVPMILVSTAIPRNVMVGIIEEALSTGSALVFRGVPKGKKVNDLQRYIASLSQKDVPSVVLDPTIFSRLGSIEVPAVAYPIGDGDRLVTVRGLVNIDWMKRTIKSKALSDSTYLGRQGMTWAATEPDFIEEMKRRAGLIDWEKKKEAAVANFWKKRPYVALQETKEANVFSFDPTMVLDQDIKVGNQVLHEGTSINPLARMSMTKRYIFFDASRPRQVQTALRLHREALAAGRQTSLIMTSFDAESGWDGFSDLTEKFDQPIYMLNTLIRDRFHLKSVPAYADAVGLEMRVTEVVPDRGREK